jgi:GST-like protein
MLQIYYWLTDNGRKALQAIEETGLPHKKVPVNLTKREQFSPDYLAISPGHKIPALADDEGPGGTRVTLCESGAMLKYLAEKAGGALYPAGAARPQVDQWFFYGSATFTPIAQQYGFFMHRSPEDVPQAKKHFGDLMRDMFGTLDKHLATSPYMAGSNFTVADIAFYPDAHLHGKQGIGLGDYPNLARWHDAVEARPATQRAWAIGENG